MAGRGLLIALVVLSGACVGAKTSGTAAPGSHEPSVCDGTTVVADQKFAMFGDFESGEIGGWFEYHTEAIHSALTVEAGGANGTRYSAHFVGGPVIGFGAQIIRPMNCLDVSHYTGVELWVKSARSTQLQLIVSTPQTVDTKVGGDCRHNCLMPVTKIRVSEQWQRYRVAFEDFRSGSGLGVHSLIMGMNIAAAGTFDLWIDQVGFYFDAAATAQ